VRIAVPTVVPHFATTVRPAVKSAVMTVVNPA
jgi:ABC-type nitrate/sulfonate/bicarbonate transport system permease component